MLSFDYNDDEDWIGIDYLTKKIPEEKIMQRIIANIKEGIFDSRVLKNHIIYVLENKLEESHPYILEEIINSQRAGYRRREFLNLYFKATKDITGLRNILPKSDIEIKWDIIEKLENENQQIFLQEFLLQILNSEDTIEEKIKASEYLIKFQNIKGLEFFTEVIENFNNHNLDLDRHYNLRFLSQSVAIPYLIRLLDANYKNDIKINRFQDLSSIILDAFYNIALVNEDNFKEVKRTLKVFINSNIQKYNNVKYILNSIERMDEQFYMNKAQSYSINQVKEKLKILET